MMTMRANIPLRIDFDAVAAVDDGAFYVRQNKRCSACQGEHLQVTVREPAHPPLAVQSNGGGAISADRLRTGRLVFGTTVRWVGQRLLDHHHDETHSQARATLSLRTNNSAYCVETCPTNEWP